VLPKLKEREGEREREEREQEQGEEESEQGGTEGRSRRSGQSHHQVLDRDRFDRLDLLRVQTLQVPVITLQPVPSPTASRTHQMLM